MHPPLRRRPVCQADRFPKGQIAVDLGVSGVPESFLISTDGVVVSKLVGGVRPGRPRFWMIECRS